MDKANRFKVSHWRNVNFKLETKDNASVCRAIKRLCVHESVGWLSTPSGEAGSDSANKSADHSTLRAQINWISPINGSTGRWTLHKAFLSIFTHTFRNVISRRVSNDEFKRRIHSGSLWCLRTFLIHHLESIGGFSARLSARSSLISRLEA